MSQSTQNALKRVKMPKKIFTPFDPLRAYMSLSMAKYGQLYGRPNYPAYSKNDVWPKNLLQTCQNKDL